MNGVDVHRHDIVCRRGHPGGGSGEVRALLLAAFLSLSRASRHVKSRETGGVWRATVARGSVEHARVGRRSGWGMHGAETWEVRARARGANLEN